MLNKGQCKILYYWQVKYFVRFIHTVMSHERRGVSNQKKLNCMFDSLIRLIPKNMKFPHHWPGGFPSQRPVTWKVLRCNHVIMTSVHASWMDYPSHHHLTRRRKWWLKYVSQNPFVSIEVIEGYKIDRCLIISNRSTYVAHRYRCYINTAFEKLKG